MINLKHHSLPVEQQQHRVSCGGWGGWCGPGHYLVTPTRVKVELRLSWAVTIQSTPVYKQ